MRFLTKLKQSKNYRIILATFLLVIGIGVAMPTSAQAAAATWTTHPASDDTQLWRGVAWSPELGVFVAVGNSGAMTSPDGITWTPQTTPDATHTWRGVAWSPQLHLFAAVGSPTTGTVNIMTSPDGITWTLRNSPLGGSPQGITWSPEQGKFVATNAPSSGAVTSTDGITWTQAPTPPSAGRNVIWVTDEDGSQYVAGRSNASAVFTSPDGDTWTSHTAPMSSLGVAYSKTSDTYVAVGTSGIMTSNDAIAWTAQTSPVTNLHAVVWSPENSEFAAVGPGGIVTSPDGITWTQETAPSSNTWDAIAWSPQLSRYVATSIDGANRTMVGVVPTTPGAPLSLTATAEGGQTKLSWNTPAFDGNSAITGYRIERSVNGGAFNVLVANTGSPTTTYNDTSVAAETKYTYRVYALNAQGQSIASNEAEVTALAILADTGMNQYALIGGALALLTIAGVIFRINNKSIHQRNPQ